MDPLNSKILLNEWKKVDEAEIKETREFLDWVNSRIEARSMDKDKSILNQLIEIKNTTDRIINDLETTYIEKYS